MTEKLFIKNNAWLLPEGIEEVLPGKAKIVEDYRRKVLDLFDVWGYELVIPPFIEYLESLLSGTGNDLDLKTFKIIDQLNGRLMGIRADMTPQVCRIDSHQLAKDEPTRLCYMGTVLHTKSDGFVGSRSPLQFGVELFGHEGESSDVEVMSLMKETFDLLELDNIYLDMGHVGIYRGLAQQAKLTEEQEILLFDALQRKALPEINELLSSFGVSDAMEQMISNLAMLNGDVSVIGKARQLLAQADPCVIEAIDNLESIIKQFSKKYPETDIHLDLAELRGYNYQTGVVFAAFVPELGQEIARGGRYNEIGKVFGRARPATGFSADLKTLISILEKKNEKIGKEIASGVTQRDLVFAPDIDDDLLADKVSELRKEGVRVVMELSEQEGNACSLGCNKKLECLDGNWTVVPL